MKVNRCLYCGKEVPALEADTFGRRVVRVAKFCRDSNCRYKYWIEKNPDKRKEYNKSYYYGRRRVDDKDSKG